MKRKFFRQGDVAIVAVNQRKNSYYKPIKRLVMAEGEITGHAHVVVADSVADSIGFEEINQWRTDKESGLRYFCRGYLRVNGKAAAVHEDHVPPIPIKSGDYEIRLQVEYSPLEFKKVQD